MKNYVALLFFAILTLPACWPWQNKETKKEAIADSIIESPHIADIYKYINHDEYNNNTLVMFDLDNTLITPPLHSDLGSDQWFYAMYQKKLDEGIEAQQAIDSVLPVYKQAIAEINFEPVEHDTVAVVSHLQQKGVHVIGLTARSIDLAYRTIEQLAHIGIDFGKDHQECPIPYGTGKPALYMDGIIFSGNYSKGEVVASWLKETNYKPKKIIFIDDKLKNLVAVEEALHKRDFPFYGLRYGYLDKRVAQFDWNKTEKDLEAFLKKHPESRPIPAH
jgi:hypothetical protein